MFCLHPCILLYYPLDRNFGIPGPLGYGNQLPTWKYLAMQPQLCKGGLGALWTNFLVSWEHFGKN